MGVQELAVADAGPLIHLDELGALQVLGVFKLLVVPDAVLREVLVHRPTFGASPPMEVGSFDPTGFRARFPHLQDGELSALSACGARGIETLVTDDLAAREAARLVGVVPVGSIGVVLRAARLGLLARDRAEDMLLRLASESTLFTTPALIEGALRALRSGSD